MQAPKSAKIIQHLRKIQFICQFFILSKVSEDHQAVPEALMVIEAVKFYFKTLSLVQSGNIYNENHAVKADLEPELTSLTTETNTPQQQTQRQRKLLQLIRQRQYLQVDHHPRMFETMSNGKQVQLVTATPLPPQLPKTPLKFRHVLGELLNILRPLVSVICIRVFGIDSYKSYFVSMVVDLVVLLVLQRGLKVSSTEDRQEIGRRKQEMVWRYLFRRPFFVLLKKYVIEPLLAKIIKPERMVSKFIMSIIEMQSSISLTL